MFRLLGQCVLLLVLATCAGLILNKTMDTDYDISQEIVDQDQFIQSEIFMDVQLEAVTLSEFRKNIRSASNPYDLIRIFLKEKDMSDNQIHELLSAKTIENLLTGKREKKREDGGYNEEEFFDYEDEKMVSAGTNQMEEELAEAYYHIDEMETSPLGQCRYPQPEIVHVEDELNLNRMFYPECTILYRCRNTSGCCGNTSQECGPKFLQVVSKTFLVLSVSEPGNGSVLPHKDMLVSKTFINHTECGCKDRKRLPGCHQDCPFPFTKFRPDLKCVCDCLEDENEDNYFCRSIKDGIYPLAEKDLECIKSRSCMPPECTNADKEFDVRSGFCPELTVDELGVRGYINKSKNKKKVNSKKHNHKKKSRGK